MTEESTPMQAPTWKNQFSTGDFFTASGLIIAGIVSYSNLSARVDNMQQNSIERRAVYEARVTALETKTLPIDSIIYRLGKQESDTMATNTRVDRMVDAFSDQLTALRKDVNEVGNKVAVLSERIQEQDRRRGDQQGMMVKPN